MFTVLASLLMKIDFFGTLLFIKKKIERLFGFDFCVVLRLSMLTASSLMHFMWAVASYFD